MTEHIIDLEDQNVYDQFLQFMIDIVDRLSLESQVKLSDARLQTKFEGHHDVKEVIRTGAIEGLYQLAYKRFMK